MSDNIKKKFEVHKLDGTLMRKYSTPKADKKGKLLGGFEYTDEEVDAGWMVYFPSGSSVHIWTKEEMERQGFQLSPSMVDMNTGDETAPTGNTSLKAISEQKSNHSRSSKSADTLN